MRLQPPFLGLLLIACGGTEAAPNDASTQSDSGSNPHLAQSCVERVLNYDGGGCTIDNNPARNGRFCCDTKPVPGGTFLRDYDGVHALDAGFPATLSPYSLDTYEVTVGRFRSFVEAFPKSRPQPGAGARLGRSNPGWDSSWPLAETQQALRLAMSNDPQTKGVINWTDQPGGNEDLPMNLLTWYEMFAFCVYDNGRLPTSAEWNFAAAGGAEQREYPWGDASPASLPTNWGTIIEVGVRPNRAKWGHADLVGNLAEAVVDGAGLVNPCSDCVAAWTAVPPYTRPVPRVRGGGFRSGYIGMEVAEGETGPVAIDPLERRDDVGFRCARDP